MSSHRWKPLVATARAGRIRGAGSEYPAERPVLTVAQVFKLAELVGRRPVGNIRKLPGGGYRLRFQRDGVVRTAQEVCPTRAVTDWTLWEMAADGREWVGVAAGLDQVGAGMRPQAEAGPASPLVLVGECLTRQRGGRDGVIFAGVRLLP